MSEFSGYRRRRFRLQAQVEKKQRDEQSTRLADINEHWRRWGRGN